MVSTCSEIVYDPALSCGVEMDRAAKRYLTTSSNSGDDDYACEKVTQLWKLRRDCDSQWSS